MDSRDGRVWVTLHSGSRNIGKEVAEVHISRAKGLEHNAQLGDMNLAVFLADSPGMDAYVRDVHWAQEYASRSREIMISLLKDAVSRHWSTRGRKARFDMPVNCHHNYLSIERVDGEDMVVTRKGAISTRNDDLAKQTEGIETRKDAGVLDEIPSVCKDLHAVMKYQSDLVEPVAHQQTVLCVKG